MDGVELHAEVTGTGDPLVILHGLFGSARNWGAIARALGETHRVHALDLRNHGSSPWTPTMSYAEMAADVARYIDDHGLEPSAVLGHSMGGKVAMLLALLHPHLVDRLLVVDIAPVAYVRTEFLTYLQAMQGLDLTTLGRRADIDAALAPAIPDPTLRAFLLQNLVNDGGTFHWRINLAGIAANLPDIIGFPTVEQQFAGPVTFLAGERSDYIRPRDRQAIDSLFPQTRLAEVGQSGHWPHAEQPQRFLALVRDALL
jgi:pimeloyl-ACP methyl ester carboxylesterase